MNKPHQSISIRDQIVPVASGRILFDSLAELEIDSVEVHVGSRFELTCIAGHSIDGEKSIKQLKQELSSKRVRISAILIATDFSTDDAETHVEWAVQIIHAAKVLDCPVVRIDPLTHKKELPPAKVRENFIHRTNQLLEKTRASGVDVGMENHGPIFNDSQVLDHILCEIADPRFGLTLDTGNLYWWGHPLSEVYALIERYAGRAKHTHIKSINYPPGIAQQRREIGYKYKRFCSPLDSGSLDLKRIVRLLRQAGYARDLCIENESLFKVPQDHRMMVLRRDVEALRRAIESA